MSLFYERVQPTTTIMKVLLLLCLALPAFGVDVEQQVIGGFVGLISTFPYQISLREEGIHTCGAALFGATRAVTAANCGGQPIAVYTIRLGSNQRTETGCDSCVMRDLDDFIVNPFFNEGADSLPNDIAVLIFTNVDFNGNVQPIILGQTQDGDFTGLTCILTGWGLTNPNGNPPDDLQQGDLTIQSNSDCEANWGNGAITAGHLCAFSDESETGCTGDEGGPLACNDNNILIGIASWGEPSCSTAYPYVFTRVQYYYAWILAQ